MKTVLFWLGCGMSLSSIVMLFTGGGASVAAAAIGFVLSAVLIIASRHVK